MAGKFGDVLTDLVTGVVNNHPNTPILLGAAMVRQLANLQAESIPFMEVPQGSFTTVANQATYTSADAGFPKSLLRFDRLYYSIGNYGRPLIVVDIGTIRLLQQQPAVAYPLRVAWHDDKLQFGPAPNAAYVVKFDSILDAQKDTASGALMIDTDGAAGPNTGPSNPWFTTGVVAFKHLVWADYFSTSPDQRAELAASHTNLAATAMSQLRKAQKKRQELNAISVVPNAFDSQLVDSTAARIANLFPGAPV
jgi:hypothetical protein